MHDSREPTAALDASLGLAHYGLALTKASQLLMICGPSDFLLQRRASELMAWLREADPKLHIEVLSSLTGEQIIARFNEMLADLSINAAVRPDSPAQPERIWVLRDSGQFQVPEIRLLAVLQQKFPAARLSSVVLTESEERFRALLQREERGILGWNLSSWANPHESTAPSETPPIVTPPESQAHSSPAQRGPSEPPKIAAVRSQGGQKLHQSLLGLVLGFVASTALVAGGLVWLHSQGQLELWRERLVSELPMNLLGGQKSADSAQPAKASEPDASATTASGDTDKPALSAQAPGGESAPSASVGDGRASAQSDRRMNAPLAPSVKEGQRWVGQLSKDNYLVLHGRFDEIKQAEQFAKRHPYLQSARLLPEVPSQAGAVLVVTGPFQSEQRSQSYIARLKLEGASPLKVADWQSR